MSMSEENRGDRLLKIYLNDHLAASLAVLELAGRCRDNNPEGPLPAFLERFQKEIDEERGAVKEILSRIGGMEDPAKLAAAWLLEKAGRFKLNGKLLGYSDLSRLEELEAIVIGVRGKIALWKVLLELAETDERLRGVGLGPLLQQGERQHEEAETFRRKAAMRAFGKSAVKAEEAGWG